MYTLELVGRIALVTGAARGIGRACVERLVLAGAKVYSADVVGHEPPQGAEAVVLDVAEEAAVDDLIASVPEPIQILVNNAGIYRQREGLEIDAAQWRRTFAVNVEGTFLCTRAVVRRLVDAALPGAVINIASVAGKRAFPMQADYCAAKAAVLGFTRAAALDVARHSVTVNAICPGTVDTPMIAQVIRDLAAAGGIGDAEQRDRLLEGIPIGRMQTPAEIAGAVVFLASTESRAVTGESFTIDGGLTRD